MANNEVKGRRRLKETDGSLTSKKLFDTGAFELQDELPACMVGSICKEGCKGGCVRSVGVLQEGQSSRRLQEIASHAMIVPCCST